MTAARRPQLAYSELMAAMLDEDQRRQKAAKIIRVLLHFLGRENLDALTVADIGCSAGFIADELASAGATTLGLDIDVPGLGKAAERFGSRVQFVCATGDALPLADKSVDVLVLNHIYEHVVDPDAVLDELHRVLAPTGVIYLGLGNRLGVVEPHYRLPFLSYLPGPLADRYVRASGRAEHYHERFRTRRGLRRMLRGFTVWDYTLPVIKDPARFSNTDVVSPRVASLPTAAFRVAMPIVPIFIWVAAKSASRPRGATLGTPPERVRVPAGR